jgi:hypothetical protein
MNLFSTLFDFESKRTPIFNIKNNTDRYNKLWYDKRILQNSRMQTFLIDIIKKHKEIDFPWDLSELRFLKNEDLAEIAVATVNKNLSIVLGMGQDYSDGSDIKCITNMARNNIKCQKNTGLSHWTNSYFVPGLKDKVGSIRVVAYNTHLNKFEFFYFPEGIVNGREMIEIPIETYRLRQGVIPSFTGKLANGKRSKWFDYRCKDFEQLATINI